MKYLIVLALFLFSLSLMGQKFHTEFKYSDSINKGISIQNSFPKAGHKYKDSNGKEYGYAIFWTCVTNETNSDLEITINFPIHSFTVPSSPDANYNLYIPRQEMTLEKEPLFNYGFDLKAFFDENIDKSSELIINISPNDSYLFYTVPVLNEGGSGPIRAGFELENRDLIYKINGYEINCGKVRNQK